MGSRRNVVALLTLVAALALVASGCGSSSESSSDETTIETETGATETDTTVEAVTEDTEAETESGAGIGALANEDCLELANVGAKLSQALGATGATADSEATTEFFDELADKAPDEIKDDLTVLAAAWQEIAATLGDVDLTSGDTPSPEDIQKLQELSTKFDTPELTEASQNLAAWSQEHCGTGG